MKRKRTDVEAGRGKRRWRQKPRELPIIEDSAEEDSGSSDLTEAFTDLDRGGNGDESSPSVKSSLNTAGDGSTPTGESTSLPLGTAGGDVSTPTDSDDDDRPLATFVKRKVHFVFC